MLEMLDDGGFLTFSLRPFLFCHSGFGRLCLSIRDYIVPVSFHDTVTSH